MAVTSIWAIKGRIDKVIDYARNPEKTEADLSPMHTIEGVLDYVADELKTERRSYVTALNCREDQAAAQFMETKRFWDKTEGRACFHGYQSFKGDEVTAEEAHSIGVETARRLWGEDFEVIVATHLNTGHYHNHFVINSVSWRDGHHYHNGPDDYRMLRQTSDEICRERGISVIQNPEGHKKNYSEYLAEKNGKPTVRGLIRADIDRAIGVALTDEEFIREMQAMGYELRLTGSHGQPIKARALKPPGSEHFFRFDNLGDGYSLDAIHERILDKFRRKVPFPKEEQEKLRRYREEEQPREPLTGLHAIYIRYSFELHTVVKYPASVKRMSLFMREELTKLDRLDRQTRFLAEKGIQTMRELNDAKRGREGQAEALKEERRCLYNDLKRAKYHKDEGKVSEIKDQIKEVSENLRKVRDEIHLCEEIEERSERRNAELNALLSEQERKEKEANENGIFRRRGGRSREDDA